MDIIGIHIIKELLMLLDEVRKITLNRILFINKLHDIEVPMYVLILKSQSTFFHKWIIYIEIEENEANHHTSED